MASWRYWLPARGARLRPTTRVIRSRGWEYLLTANRPIRSRESVPARDSGGRTVGASDYRGVSKASLSNPTSAGPRGRRLTAVLGEAGRLAPAEIHPIAVQLKRPGISEIQTARPPQTPPSPGYGWRARRSLIPTIPRRLADGANKDHPGLEKDPAATDAG